MCSRRGPAPPRSARYSAVHLLPMPLPWAFMHSNEQHTTSAAGRSSRPNHLLCRWRCGFRSGLATLPRAYLSANVFDREAEPLLWIACVAEQSDNARHVRVTREGARDDLAEELALNLEPLAAATARRPAAAASKRSLELDAHLALQAAQTALAFSTQYCRIARAVATLMAATACNQRSDLLLFDSVASATHWLRHNGVRVLGPMFLCYSAT